MEEEEEEDVVVTFIFNFSVEFIGCEVSAEVVST